MDGVAQENKKTETESTINELDKFLGPDMKNVEVEELDNKVIENEKETFSKVDSDFIDKILMGKLSNLENMLVSRDGGNNPVFKLNEEFVQMTGKEINYLPDINEIEKKSLSYVSKMLCSLLTRAHLKFNNPIPTSTPILKYKVSNFKEDNLNLAYDLLLTFAYIRTLKNRISDKIDDFIENKSRFYLQARCYLDVFCFSFLEKVDKKQLKTIITNRYRYYDSIGFFDDYKELLKKYNCVEIRETDIDNFVYEACEKVIGKSMYIVDQHDSLVESNSFRLPSKNNFTLEQIINEIIPLEVDEKMGVEINDPERHKYASAEIINWFVKNTEPKVKKTKKEKSSNILRFVTHFRSEIPEQYREEFLEWIKKFKDTNFTFDDCKYPLAEFGSNIIKGLYLWKPEDDKKILTNYKYFWSQYEECMLEKDHILALDQKSDTKTDDWSNVFDQVQF